MCLWKHEKEFWNNYEVLEISNLYVEEEYRRRGIGTALVELAKNEIENNIDVDFDDIVSITKQDE